MTFLRAWGLVLTVTAWLVALILGLAAVLSGAAVLLAAVACVSSILLTGRVYVSEMREWRQYGHPRNRR